MKLADDLLKIINEVGEKHEIVEMPRASGK
jgi:hypothetical protein